MKLEKKKDHCGKQPATGKNEKNMGRHLPLLGVNDVVIREVKTHPL